MRRVLYLSHATPAVYEIIRRELPAGFELLTSGGFVENSADGSYCSFEDDRVQELFDILKPLYEGQGTEIADSVVGLYTNEYCADAPGR